MEITETEIKRRDFLKGAALSALGVASAGVLAACNAPSEANAEADAETPAEGGATAAAPAPVTVGTGATLTLEEINKMRHELVDSKGEYTLSDGTVIPAVYVKLRSLIDTYGNGVGSELTDTSFSEVMYHFSEDEAQAYLEMPYGIYFTAVDYSVESGRTEEDCLAILEDMAARGLLMRVRRGGMAYFHQLAEAHGIWEYCLLADDSPEYVNIHGMQWGGDIINQLYNAETPFYYAIPVNKEVVAGEAILPYDDYEKIIARNSVFAVSDCQCRLSHQSIGVEDPGDHPLETCLTTGEQAEYYIENGIGRQIDAEEALAILKRSVEAGLVLQSAWTKDTEVICSCHGDCCDILGSYVALGDAYPTLNTSKTVSHYSLAYDQDACIKCGACAARCPMSTITMGEEGFPEVGPICVRCGQCGTVCPAAARKLEQNAEVMELPQSLLDDYNLKGGYRLSNNMIY